MDLLPGSNSKREMFNSMIMTKVCKDLRHQTLFKVRNQPILKGPDLFEATCLCQSLTGIEEAKCRHPILLRGSWNKVVARNLISILWHILSNNSGSNERISRRIARSTFPSELSRERAPYRITFLWLINDVVALDNGIHVRNDR